MYFIYYKDTLTGKIISAKVGELPVRSDGKASQILLQKTKLDVLEEGWSLKFLGEQYPYLGST